MTIRLQDVKKTWTGPAGEAVEVLDVPELEIVQGRHLCLTGSSGAGKTTLLNVVAGIVLPSAGSVCHDDVDITGLTEAQRDRFRAANVGYVFQTFNLIQGLSALDNVALALSFAGKKGVEARQRAAAVLERVGLTHRRDARPGTLSVGEQQRVAIARALANEPAVILADEPTANLDEANGENVLDLLQETAEESAATLLIVTHETRVRERFTDVLALEEISRCRSAS